MKKEKKHFKITKMWKCPLRCSFVLNNLNICTSQPSERVQSPELETLSSILPKAVTFSEIVFSVTSWSPQGSNLFFYISVTDSAVWSLILSVGFWLLICRPPHPSRALIFMSDPSSPVSGKNFFFEIIYYTSNVCLRKSRCRKEEEMKISLLRDPHS